MCHVLSVASSHLMLVVISLDIWGCIPYHSLKSWWTERRAILMPAKTLKRTISPQTTSSYKLECDRIGVEPLGRKLVTRPLGEIDMQMRQRPPRGGSVSISLRTLSQGGDEKGNKVEKRRS